MPLKSWQDLLQDAGGANGSYDALPDGDYDLVVSEAEAKNTSTGKTMYKTKNVVESGPHKGRIVWHNHVISPESPNALRWFFRNMAVLGLDDQFFLQNPAEHQVAEALQNRRFRAQLKTRQYQGQDQNEIKQFFTARSSVDGPAAPASNGPAPAPSPAVAPAPASAPSGPPPAPAPAPAPAYAAPAPATAQAPPPPPAAAPPAPPVVQTTPPPPPPAAAPPAAPPLPAAEPVAAAATTPGVPVPPDGAPF